MAAGFSPNQARPGAGPGRPRPRDRAWTDLLAWLLGALSLAVTYGRVRARSSLRRFPNAGLLSRRVVLGR